MANEELAFDLVSKDKGANDGIAEVGRTSAAAALKIDQANLRVEKSARTAAAAEEKFGKGSLEARDAALKLAAAQQNLERALRGTEDSLHGAEDAAAAAGEGMKGFGATVAAVGGAALAAGVGAAISKALDIEAGLDKLQGQLGATAQEAERYGAVAGKVYSGAFGESLGDVNDAIKNVTQNIGQLGDSGSSSLQSITEDTLSLAQAFGVDLFDTTKAAGALLRTGLAPDAQYALDLITVGLQKIPGAQEDLLDTLTEYSVQFAALGLTGDQALSFIGAAMRGGARNTDLAADALKEFNLRAKDTTNTGAQSAISELGLSASDTAEAIAGGGGGAVSAMAELLTRLREIPDPADRSRLATQLLGTQAEDLQDALFAVDPAEFIKGLDGVAGASDRLNATLSDNGAARIEAYQRKLELLITSAAGADGPLGTAAAGVAAFGGSVAAGAVGAAQLVGGLSLIPGAGAKAVTALNAVRTSAILLAPVLAAVGTAAAADLLGDYIGKAQVAETENEKLTKSLLQLGQGGKLGAEGLKLFQRSGVFGLVKNDADTTADALDRFATQADNALGDNASSKFNRAISFGKSLGQLKETASTLDASFAALAKGGNLDAADEAFTLFIKAGTDAGAPVEKLTALFPQYNAAVKTASETIAGAGSAAKGMTTDLTDQAYAAAAARKAQDELNTEMKTYADALLGLRGDQRAFEAAVDDAATAVETNGKTLDITTAKGRNNAAALDEIASAGLKLAEQTPAGVDAQKHFADTIATTRARLIDAGREMGLTRGQARRLAESILGVPKSRNIRVTSNIDSQIAKIRGLQTQLNRVDGREYSYTVKEILESENRRDAATAGRHRATGGPVAAGSAYIVGERGEELFVPKENGFILPEVPRPGLPPQSRKPYQVGVGVESPNRAARLELAIVSGPNTVDQLLVEVLRNAIRLRAGGNVQAALGHGKG